MCWNIIKHRSLNFPARDTDNGTKVCGELSKELSATNIQFHPLDITSKESINKLRDHVRDRFGGLDVLINNSGVYLKVGQGTLRDMSFFLTIGSPWNQRLLAIEYHSIKAAHICATGYLYVVCL